MNINSDSEPNSEMGPCVRRSTRKRIGLAAVLVAALCLVLWIGHLPRQKKNTHLNIRQYPNLSAMKNLQKKKVPLEPNQVKSRPSSLLLYEDCISLPESPIETAKICVYPGKFDTKYSEVLKRGKLFEKELVTQMTKMLRYDHEMQLVDLGANIGEYTLMAAAWGSQVLAVETYPDNIRQLQTSLSVSGLSNYVTLINNAFWSDHRKQTVQHISRAKVQKGLYVNIPKTNFNKWGLTSDNTGVNTIYTICMDDLLPFIKHRKVYLKMDMDGNEAEALKCAIKFFDLVDVRVVQMKWVYKTQDDIDKIKKFMENEFGFRASRDPKNYVPMSINTPTALKGNVYWLPGATDEAEEEESEREEEEEEAEIRADREERNKYKDADGVPDGMKRIMLQPLLKDRKPNPFHKKSRKQKEKEFRFHQEFRRDKKMRGGIFFHNNMVG